jgi:hypothetical protein
VLTSPGTISRAVGSQQSRASSTVRGVGASHVLSAQHTAGPAARGILSGTLPFTGLAVVGWLALGASLVALGLGLRRGRATLV